MKKETKTGLASDIFGVLVWPIFWISSFVTGDFPKGTTTMLFLVCLAFTCVCSIADVILKRREHVKRVTRNALSCALCATNLAWVVCICILLWEGNFPAWIKYIVIAIFALAMFFFVLGTIKDIKKRRTDDEDTPPPEDTPEE